MSHSRKKKKKEGKERERVERVRRGKEEKETSGVRTMPSHRFKTEQTSDGINSGLLMHEMMSWYLNRAQPMLC